MADCSFSLPLVGSAQSIVDKARAAITQAGGQFHDSDQSGSFSVPTPVGSIEGRYTIANNSMKVDINRKPFFISCGLIEKQLSGYFAAFEEGA